ncbi:carbohydrate sulfotransferase 15-like [Lytechinus variegatus]|uniref:carbohydrate sulfotransferase 15-like n=1 Tax=Lytechinus variegatus TaxID=7654 RepID=UPI001BB13AF4|nr:carbohydrate sulfotransferase 15-like [Lytechinus variegatus]XP_041460784.1 carbohydrate sulfotransferase 15-like [Lytechinus variegatus]
MMIRKRRLCRCLLILMTTVTVFCVYHFISVKIPRRDGKSVVPVELQQVREKIHIPEADPIKAAQNTTGKDTAADTPKGSIVLEVLDAEGNPISEPALRKEVQKITKNVPTTFLPNFKNPCWFDSTNQLNCLPYFYLIGMSKCGTTDLWKKLTSHPDIVDLPKEPHWWGPRRTGWTGLAAHGEEVQQVREKTGDTDDSSIRWYLNWFKMFAVKKVHQATVINETSGETYHPAVFGDGSISTAYSIGNAWIEENPNATDPPYTNAELLHAIQPKAKIIIILRNPTERARSWYYYTHPFNTPDDWHMNAMTSIECYNSCMTQHNERYCAYAFGCPYTPFQGINVGLYHIFLYDWINVYTREGVLVLRLEDWHKDPVSVYRTILQFLDLRPLTALEEAKILGNRWVQVSTKETQSETKKALDDFYRPHNKKLAELLQNDIYRYP